jgi:hypothetical protein
MRQTVSVYLISYAIMRLFLGPWSDAHGRKPVILEGTFLYAFSSAAAGAQKRRPPRAAPRQEQKGDLPDLDCLPNGRMPQRGRLRVQVAGPETTAMNTGLLAGGRRGLDCKM